jgi:hypothetical protein
VKRLLLLLAVCLVAATAAADEITFSFIELGNGAIDVTCGTSGCAFGPALNIVVSDVAKGLQFPLAGTFNASSGSASGITVMDDRYLATYATGGSVSIVAGGTTLVSGTPIFADSHLSADNGDEGSFHGEFSVTDVSGSVLAMFGLPDKWKPIGSVSITFGHSDVNGDNLTGVIGGGTVTIETPGITPEPPALLLSGTSLLIILLYGRYRWQHQIKG